MGWAEIESRVSEGRKEYRKGGFHGNIKTIPSQELRVFLRARMEDRVAGQILYGQNQLTSIN